MKKRIISVLIVSAMTAASAMSVTAFAESTDTSVSMDNPFSGCFEKQSNSEWKITDRGMKLINDDISEGGGVFNLHFMLKKHAEGSIIWNFSFTAEEKTYEADYIMMIPMYSAEEGTNLYLPVKDVIGLLNDTYPDEKIPYDKIEFGTVKDSAKIITDIEITAKSVFPSLTDHVWATYEKDENGKYTKPSNYFIFDDNENGHTFDSEFVTGQGFTYEQDDNKLVFHFGSVTDEAVPAELKFNKSGDIIATITYPETTKTVKFELIPSAETQSFGVVPMFTGSVWTAYGEDENGDYTELWNYFVFKDDGTGSTIDPKTGTGVPFAYDQNGEDVMFHFGSIDDETSAVFESKGLDIYATIDYGEFTKRIRFAHEYTEADPETFNVSPEDEMEFTGAIFTRGVWAAYDGDRISRYFVFYDETSGAMVNADDIGAAPFSCEQNGLEIMFRFGGADDSTKAVFSTGDNTGTFDFDGTTVSYRFELVPDADPDTFGADSSEDPDFIDTDTGWELIDAQRKIAVANATADGILGIEIKFDNALDNGFDIAFKLVTDDGSQKNIAAVYSGSVSGDTIFVNIRDLLAQVGAGAENVTSLTVVNNGDNSIASVEMGFGDNATAVRFGTINAAVDSAKDSNPSTGVGIGFAAFGAVIAGAAAAVSYRKRR